jgi:hypothetical protein
MKNADRPFIGIIIVTIAVMYGVIALLSQWENQLRKGKSNPLTG